MTTIPAPTILVPADHDSDHLPAGLRVSTTCWTRKVLQLIEPERFVFREKGTGQVVDFDRGIGQRGNDIEALVLGRKFGLSAHGVGSILLTGKQLKRGELDCGGRVATQVVLPWSGGVSHIDWVVTGSPEAWKNGVWEHKSGAWDLPEGEHYDVVQLRMYLAEQAGMPEAEMPWKLMLTDPAWYRNRGPFTVHLDDVLRSEIADKLERLNRVRHKIGEFDPTDESQFEGLTCTCSQCFDERYMDVEGMLRYLLEDYADAAEVIAAAETDDVVEAREFQADLKTQIRELVGPGEKHRHPESEWQIRTTSPKPKRKVAWEKADKAGLVRSVVGDDVYADLQAALEREAYVDEGVPNPTLYVERKPA